jgi:hypothetical protein
MDFSEFSPAQFELLVARLLVAEGYRVVEANVVRRGLHIDLITTTPGGESCIVESLLRKSSRVSRSDVKNLISNIQASRTLLNVQRGLIVISGVLIPTAANVGLVEPGIEIWDGIMLQVALDRHRDVRAEFDALIEQTRRIENRLTLPTRSPTPTPSQLFSADLQRRLAILPAGKGYWKAYEEVCVEILNFLFVPPLGVPAIQTSSEDELDRRDAVYPLREGDRFWDLVRSDFRTRLVVAEFKNYTDPIGQTEVESIQQYLYAKAFRMFGLLCTRKPPSESALKARRRAWNEHDKMIVILTDSDLAEMLRMKGDGEKPTTVIEDQLEEFLTDLAP